MCEFKKKSQQLSGRLPPDPSHPVNALRKNATALLSKPSNQYVHTCNSADILFESDGHVVTPEAVAFYMPLQRAILVARLGNNVGKRSLGQEILPLHALLKDARQSGSYFLACPSQASFPDWAQFTNRTTRSPVWYSLFLWPLYEFRMF